MRRSCSSLTGRSERRRSGRTWGDCGATVGKAATRLKQGLGHFWNSVALKPQEIMGKTGRHTGSPPADPRLVHAGTPKRRRKNSPRWEGLGGAGQASKDAFLQGRHPCRGLGGGIKGERSQREPRFAPPTPSRTRRAETLCPTRFIQSAGRSFAPSAPPSRPRPPFRRRRNSIARAATAAPVPPTGPCPASPTARS